MRCGCPTCGTYMAHAEGADLGCICPECARRCKDCLGTNTVISREQLAKMREDPGALEDFFSMRGRPDAPDAPSADREPPGPDPWA